jgi:hypothetical protein
MNHGLFKPALELFVYLAPQRRVMVTISNSRRALQELPSGVEYNSLSLSLPLLYNLYDQHQ